MEFFSSLLFFFFHESETVFQLLVFRKFLKAFVNIQKISSCHQTFLLFLSTSVKSLSSYEMFGTTSCRGMMAQIRRCESSRVI